MGRVEQRWDPHAAHAPADQLEQLDALRARCPITHDRDGAWAVLSHAESAAVLDDPLAFSSAVSAHPALPNGLDGEEHRRFRAVVDRYFLPERVAQFAPACRAAARELVRALPIPGTVEVVGALAEPFAARITCAFMGWPHEMERPLLEWMAANRSATRARDREAQAEVARSFDGHIRARLDACRARASRRDDDVTARLLRERIDGRPLSDEQIVAIVRNWTVGELGTMSASAAILVDFLAHHREVQSLLRACDDPRLFDAVTDEALRIRPPLIANRRRTTRRVRLGGRLIPAGERVVVLWASANRDETVFHDPDEPRLDRDPRDNLLYGRGVHACPGAGLARMELRVLLDELLGATHEITPPPEGEGERAFAVYPAGGFSRLTVELA